MSITLRDSKTGSTQKIGRVPRKGGGYETGVVSTTTRTATGGSSTVRTAGAIEGKSITESKATQAAVEAVNQERLKAEQPALVGTNPQPLPTRNKPLPQTLTTQNTSGTVTSPVFNRPVTQAEIDAGKAVAASNARIEAAKAQARAEDYNAPENVRAREIAAIRNKEQQQPNVLGLSTGKTGQTATKVYSFFSTPIEREARVVAYKASSKVEEIGRSFQEKPPYPGAKQVGYVTEAIGSTAKKAAQNPTQSGVDLGVGYLGGKAIGLASGLGAEGVGLVTQKATGSALGGVIATKATNAAITAGGGVLTYQYFKNTEAKDVNVIALTGFGIGAAKPYQGTRARTPITVRNGDTVFYRTGEGSPLLKESIAKIKPSETVRAVKNNYNEFVINTNVKANQAADYVQGLSNSVKQKASPIVQTATRGATDIAVRIRDFEPPRMGRAGAAYAPSGARRSPMSKQSMRRTGAGLPANKNIKVGKDYFSQKNPLTREQLTKYKVGDQSVVKYKGFGQERMVVTTPQPLKTVRALDRIPGTRTYSDVVVNVPQYKQIEYVNNYDSNNFVAPNTNTVNKGFFSVPGTKTKDVQLYGSARQIAAQRTELRYAPNSIAKFEAPKQNVLVQRNSNIGNSQFNNGLVVPSMELTPNAQQGYSRYAYNPTTGGKGNEALTGRGRQGRVYIEIQNRLRARVGSPNNIQGASKPSDLALVPYNRQLPRSNEIVPLYNPGTGISLSQGRSVSINNGRNELIMNAASKYGQQAKYNYKSELASKTEIGAASRYRSNQTPRTSARQTTYLSQRQAQRSEQITSPLIDYSLTTVTPTIPVPVYPTYTPPPPRPPPPVTPTPRPPRPEEFYSIPPPPETGSKKKKTPFPGMPIGLPGGGGIGGGGKRRSGSGGDKFTYAPTFTAAFFGIKATKKQRKNILAGIASGKQYTGTETIRPLI